MYPIFYFRNAFMLKSVYCGQLDGISTEDYVRYIVNNVKDLGTALAGVKSELKAENRDGEVEVWVVRKAVFIHLA